MKIWLTDLTYTQQSIASDILPAAIGMIAEYASLNMKKSTELKLFKYPEELIDSFENESPPDVFACSNYVWNFSLSSMFCKRIKEVKTETGVIRKVRKKRNELSKSANKSLNKTEGSHTISFD